MRFCKGVFRCFLIPLQNAFCCCFFFKYSLHAPPALASNRKKKLHEKHIYNVYLTKNNVYLTKINKSVTHIKSFRTFRNYFRAFPGAPCGEAKYKIHSSRHSHTLQLSKSTRRCGMRDFGGR